MAIVYTSVTLDTASITTRGKATIDIFLTNLPTGTVYGSVIVNNHTFPIMHRMNKEYYAQVWGGRAGRMTAATVYVIMGDVAGPVLYAGALTLTVLAPTEPFVVQPLEWIKTTLSTYWDTTIMPKPGIYETGEVKGYTQLDLVRLIEIREGEVETESHGQGQYKTNKYPIEIICRSEHDANSKDIARNILAEVKSILETYWNDIAYTGLDFIEYSENDGVNLSMEASGRHEWRWNIKIVGVLRGRAGTPGDPVV